MRGRMKLMYRLRLIGLIVLVAAAVSITVSRAAADSVSNTEPVIVEGLAEADLVARLTAEDRTHRLEALKNVMSRVEAGEPVSAEILRAVVDRLSDAEMNITEQAEAILERVGSSALDELAAGLERYAGDRWILVRRTIARIMGTIGSAAVQHLAALLGDPAAQVRLAAAESLGKIGEEALQAAEALREMVMNKEEDPNVRAAGVSALAGIGACDEASLLALVLARADSDFRVAFAANNALTKLAPSTKALIDVLMEAIDDSRLEFSAREALVWVATQSADFANAAVEYIQEADVSQRARLVRELQYLYGRLNENRKAELVSIFGYVLRNENLEVRAAALAGVSKLGDLARELVPELSSIALDPGEDLETRRAAMLGWENIGFSTPDTAAQLMELAIAPDEDDDIRRSAVRILAAVRPATKDVAALILDNLPFLSEAWSWRLAPVVVEAGKTDSSIVDRLVMLLSDSSSFERLFAIRALSAIGEKARLSAPALSRELESEKDPFYRRAIARALVQIVGSDMDGTVLQTLIDDQDRDVRRIVKNALGLPDTEGAVEQVKAIPAFPGAEGFGMWTVGGRGGSVYVVTNLNDSGPGSLREAVQASGPRIVVFAVSGTIHLKSRLEITNPYITIAGQTAPGDGITIADYDVVIRADEVILRYLRFRLGDRTRQEVDTLYIDRARNVIVDHVSTSWSVDETLSVSASDNVTVQWCFITESLNRSVHSKGAHGYGSLVRGEYGSKYSFHHNLWAHHSGRMPRPGNYTDHSLDKQGALMDFRNNVFYNWGRGYSGSNHDTNSITMYNFINNYYKRGPNSTGNFAFREECPYAKAYFSGNMMNGVEPADPWSLVDARLNRGVYENEYKQSEPFPAGFIRTEPADVAYERVLNEAGMHPRDEVDRRIVDEVINGRGRIINSQDEVGGWPELRSEAPPADSDGDGIPDWWCVKYGFDPVMGLDPSGDLDGDGYTNIEEYLNGTDPDHYVDYSW